MKQISQNESGAMSIESVIGMTFFTLAIIAIMFISMIIKVQSTMQYALSQTAKEISGYYYLLDKTGLTKLASGTNTNAQAAAENVNTVIGDVIDFSHKGSDAFEDAESLVNSVQNNEIDLSTLPKLKGDIQNQQENLEKLSQAADKMVMDFEMLKDDPAGQLKGIFSVFAKTMINKGLSYYIAPHVCRAIMPRYLAGDTESSNKMLEAMGVALEGRTGMDSLDFTQTQLLADGRSIKLVVIYKINPEKMTLGFVKLPQEQWPVFRQTACTAAWIYPDGENTRSVVEASKITEPYKENEEEPT